MVNISLLKPLVRLEKLSAIPSDQSNQPNPINSLKLFCTLNLLEYFAFFLKIEKEIKRLLTI